MTSNTLTRAPAGRTFPPPVGLPGNPAGQQQSDESTRNQRPDRPEVTRRLAAIYEFLQPYELADQVCSPSLLKLSPDEKECLIRVECVRISLGFKRKWERKRLSPAQVVKEIENELAQTKLSIARRQDFLGDPDHVLSEKQVGDSRQLLEGMEKDRGRLETKLQAARNFERSARRVDPETGESVKNHKYARYSFPLPKELLLLSCQRLLAVFGRPHQGWAVLRFAVVVIGLVRPTGQLAEFSETELERSWRVLRSMQQHLDQPSVVRRWKRRKREERSALKWIQSPGFFIEDGLVELQAVSAGGHEKLSRLPLWACVLGPSFLTDSDALLPW